MWMTRVILQVVEIDKAGREPGKDGGCMNEGKKDDFGKLRYDLVPPYAFEQFVSVLTYGALKYDDRNWEKGIKWGRLFGAAMRHLWAFWRGDDIDPESGIPHLAHAVCNIMMLLEYSKLRPEYDDRLRVMEVKPNE